MIQSHLLHYSLYSFKNLQKINIGLQFEQKKVYKSY